ncbi:hypothetical protein [Nocardiopsis composta]|uniref:Uncharacterized protein n=1 Tax=Nocardiopsis composta TaxID=157465 RepID=A0A7W8QGX0_9ACTN|nr:hypothetical protein [Nocardiopsis composta]MBB5430243.1 hypothetical protein [Nocardiopsis composta]
MTPPPGTRLPHDPARAEPSSALFRSRADPHARPTARGDALFEPHGEDGPTAHHARTG